MIYSIDQISDLVDDDAALELQFLPPTVSGKCGHPKCPYPIQPDLPPIHWDCPDPLPKGTCKNLNCPFQPRDLKKFKCPAPKPGPCGSPDCPYALPPPCDLPTCPFRPNPTCSFLEKQQNQQSKSCYQPDEEEEDYVCENPECPFANEKINVSESFDQPDLAGHFVDCFNPECPFATKGKQRPKSKSDKINICSNPSCPFANIKKQNVCSNPSCPYALIQKKQNRSYGDPQCPFAKKTITKSKQNKSDICDNPNCPYASKNGTSDLQRYKSKNNEVCDNPECPFNETESTKSKSKGSDLCDNPKCPFADKNGLSDGRKNKNKDNSEICENPDCPFRETQSTKNESKGSGIYDNPKCPFAGKNSPSHALKNKTKTNTKLCDNPDCPFNEENCSKASADCNVSENICENPECPYAEETEKPTICDDPLCPYMQPLPSCGIPGCPYEPVTCPGPKKRSVVKKITPSNDAEAFVLMETVITQVSIEKGDDGKKCAGDGDGDGSPNAQRSGKGDKKGRKKRSKFVYSMGNQYPGVKVGHKECVTPTFKVPPKMGWLWNIPMEVMNLKVINQSINLANFINCLLLHHTWISLKSKR